MTGFIGRLSYRHRWLVLLIWLGVMMGGVLAAGSVFERMGDRSSLGGTESGAAQQLLRDARDDGGTVVALWEGPVGAVSEVDLTGLPGAKDVTTVKRDRGVAIIVTLERDADIDPIAERLKKLETPGTTLRLGGSEIMDEQIDDAVQADLGRAEFGSLPVTVLVMIFVFGGIVAAGLPLIATLATVAGAFAVLLGFSHFVDLDADIISVVSMLGLALCIDYSLLLVARYREELAAGHPDPLTRTWQTAGRTITFSALIVAAALAGLLFIDVPRLQAMGAAGISATVVALLSALTLTAALLRIFKLKPAKAVTHGTFFARLAGITQRRPLLWALGTAAVLLAMGAPLLGGTVKLPDMAGLPRDIESVQVFDDLRAHYGQDESPAISVVARTDPSTLDAWAARWAHDADPGKAREVAPGVAVVGFTVAGDSQSQAARDLVIRMRAGKPAGVEAWVTGDAAVLIDVGDKILAGLPVALGVIAAAMFVLLFLMTGSLVVPIKALAMNVVSLGATFGVLVAVFEHGWLSGPLGTLTVGGLSPFMMVLVFAFGFGLSMDYEVFLLSRIKERVDAGDRTDLAVQTGLQHSGRIITSAAVLMLIVFGFFAAARLGDIEQIGLGLFVAVLIDATIVRCLLVPATMTLLGRWNWWAPHPLRRLHTRVALREEPVPLSG